jgi:ABC-2 type transport system ATP-binding protein
MNGAGKTTTLRLLLGMAMPDRGAASVCGLPVQPESSSVQIRARAALLPEQKDLFPYMNAGQVLRYTRGFYPRWRHDLEKRLVEEFGIPLHTCVTRLSKGKLGQLHLVLALCRGVEVVFLDEPTDGLDPVATERALTAMVELVAEGSTTVVFCSHRLNEIEQVSDYLCLIHEGRLLLDGALDELKASTRRIVATFDSGLEQARDALAAGGRRVQMNGRTLTWMEQGDWRAAAAQASSLGAVNVQAEPAGLREIFLDRVRA